jgi:hypothetical protein
MMKHLNKDSSNSCLTPALLIIAVITTTAILSSPFLATSNLGVPAAAAATTTTTAGNNNNATTTITQQPSSEMIQLSPQPIYQGQLRITGAIPLNQTHVSSTNSGNGILTLPGTGESINVTSNGWAIFSHILQFGQGEVTITTTEQEGGGGSGGEETATVRFYESVQFNPSSGERKGLMVADFHTNSTGILAPLNGMVVAGIDHFQPNVQDSSITLWEWQSGIGNFRVMQLQGQQSQTNNTITTTTTPPSEPSP